MKQRDEVSSIEQTSQCRSDRMQEVMSNSNQGRLSVMSEATPIHFHEPEEYESTIVFDFESDGSESEGSADTATKANLNQSRRSMGMTMAERKASQRFQPEKSSYKSERMSVMSNPNQGRLSVMSEATPIHFHEPEEYESTIVFDFEFDGSESEGRADTATKAKLNQSRRSMGMTMAERKASQRIQAELFHHAIDEDAERDIVNVYLEASAFADRERLNLTEDIYSFLLACSACSLEFWTAVYFIFVKYICYSVIFVNLTREEYAGEGRELAVLATKFIMIPVAVAMQEDLITVYFNVANKKYDALTHKGNVHATEVKWILSNLFRAIDGIMSLAVNFGVMLYEIDLLNIFLSFAALHFLQFIDDVIYELAEKGFFGQKLEEATIQCKIITFTRRTSSGDHCNNFITKLNTILLFSSMAACYFVYAYFLVTFYSVEENTFFGLEDDFDVP